MLDTLLGLGRTESRSLLDNPNVSLSDPASFDYLTNSVATDAGINVSPKAVLRLPPVWQAVTMISGDIAALPLDVFIKDQVEGRVVDMSNPVHRLVRHQASENVTALELWQTAMVHALVWNNGYVYIDRLNDGTPIGLYNLLPDRTHPELIKGKWWYITETVRQDGTPWLRPLPAANVIHIKGISFDGIVALDLVESARHSWACAIAAQKFESKFFRNGVRAGGILELPLGQSKTVQDKVEEGFKKQSGEDNWFRTVILRDGAKFHQQTFDPQSAQIVELGEAKVRDTARWFNLQPSRLGLSDSVSYNSKSEDNKGYLDTTLNVWLLKICGQCNMRLLTADDIRSGKYFEHNTASLLRMALSERYQAYSLAFGRWLNRNDIRALENMTSTGPDGDKFTRTPVQGDSAGGADKKGNAKPRGPAKRSSKEDPFFDENLLDQENLPALTDERTEIPRTEQKTIELRRLVFTLADHARKKAENPKAFLEFVDGNLSFHRQRSQNVESAADWIDRAVSTLKALAETKSANELKDAVDKAMLDYEQRCP